MSVHLFHKQNMQTRWAFVEQAAIIKFWSAITFAYSGNSVKFHNFVRMYL